MMMVMMMAVIIIIIIIIQGLKEDFCFLYKHHLPYERSMKRMVCWSNAHGALQGRLIKNRAGMANGENNS
eukprot:2747697-Karenia_brevis.AAC.1